MKISFERVIEKGLFQINILTVHLEEDLFNDPEYAVGGKKHDDFILELKQKLEPYKNKMEVNYTINGQDSISKGRLCFNIAKVPEIVNVDNYNDNKQLIDAITSAAVEVFTGHPPVHKRKPYIQEGCPHMAFDARNAGDNLQQLIQKGPCFGCLGLHILVDEQYTKPITSCPLF